MRLCRPDLILFVGGMLMGICLATAVAVGWASVALAERGEFGHGE